MRPRGRLPGDCLRRRACGYVQANLYEAERSARRVRGCDDVGGYTVIERAHLDWTELSYLKLWVRLPGLPSGCLED